MDSVTIILLGGLAIGQWLGVYFSYQAYKKSEVKITLKKETLKSAMEEPYINRYGRTRPTK